EKHDMRWPVRDAIAAVPLLRHHVAHRTGFHRWQFFFLDGGHNGFVCLSFGASRQDQLGPFEVAWKERTRRCLVVTNRSPNFCIPKVSVRRRSPRTFHDTRETVFAFDRYFETMTSESHDLCIA